MAHSHEAFVDGCFACKIRTVQFGRVPGGVRSNGHDTQALEDQFGKTAKEIEASELERTEGFGPLRWDEDGAYYKDKNGDYTKMTHRDWNQFMYGSDKDPDGLD